MYTPSTAPKSRGTVGLSPEAIVLSHCDLHFHKVPSDCRVVPLDCRVVPLDCREVPLYCRVVPLDCRMVPLDCRVVPWYCRVVPWIVAWCRWIVTVASFCTFGLGPSHCCVCDGRCRRLAVGAVALPHRVAIIVVTSSHKSS